MCWFLVWNPIQSGSDASMHIDTSSHSHSYIRQTSYKYVYIYTYIFASFGFKRVTKTTSKWTAIKTFVGVNVPHKITKSFRQWTNKQTDKQMSFLSFRTCAGRLLGFQDRRRKFSKVRCACKRLNRFNLKRKWHSSHGFLSIHSYICSRVASTPHNGMVPTMVWSPTQ